MLIANSFVPRNKYRYVEPVLLLYMLAVSAEYTFVQELMSIKLCANKLNLNDTDQLSKLCEKRSSFKLYESEYLSLIQWYNSIFYIFPLISTTMMSSWTDLFGRRFTLMVPVLFSLFVQIIFLYASTQILQQNILIYIMVGGFLSGISGSSSTVISSTHSYLANHVKKSQITKRLTILEACIFIGGFLGYNLTSTILTFVDPREKFIIGFTSAALIHLCLVFYIKLFLHDKDERQIKFGKLINVRHFVDCFRVLIKPRADSRRGKLFMLFYCALASSLALSVQQMLLFTYLKGNFQWTTERYSKLQGGISLMNGLSLVVFFPVIQWCLKRLFDSAAGSRSNIVDAAVRSQPELLEATEQSEEIERSPGSIAENRPVPDDVEAEKNDLKIDTIIIALGFLSKFLGLGLLGILTNDTYLLYFVPFLFMFNEFAMPGVRSMISKTVDADEKGKAFGLLGFTRNLCYFTGSFLFKYIYSVSHAFYKGLSFELVALFQISAIVLIR